MVMKKILFLIVLAFQLKTGHAQSQGSFQGVYYVEQPAVLLVLENRDVDYTGYLSDGQQVISLKGKANGENVLELETVMNGVTTKSFASLDAAGNLLMADEQLNVLYFTRSEESVKKVMQGFEQVLKEATPQEKSTLSKERTTGVGADVRYADKKFLHLYTGNGYSEKWAYYLFGNGTFYYRSNSSYLSGNAFSDFSAATASNEGGTWSITSENGAEYLVLSWNSGESGKMQISKTKEGYYLNNTKYFLVGLDEYE